MANDPMRSKAAAIFGKDFMNTMQSVGSGKQVNSAQALQKRANTRPIPAYKDGGAISKKEVATARVANRADAAGYRKGGKVQTSADTARELATEMGGMAKGGRAQARYDRKIKDIESDYAKAMKGKNPDVAKAKYEQRMADARDDMAKWTGADRTATSAAEKAAESALTTARKTKGQSIRDRDAQAGATRAAQAAVAKADVERGPVTPSKMDIKPMEVAVQQAKARAKAPVARAAPAMRQAAAAPAPVVTSPAFERLSTMNPMATAARPAAASAPAARTPLVNLKTTSPSDRASANAARLEKLRQKAEAPGATGYDKSTYEFYRKHPTAAKDGGKIAKCAVGGTGKERKGMMKKKEGGSVKKPTTGPSTTIAVTVQAQADRKAFEREMERRNREAQEQAKREGKAYNPDHKAKGGAAKVRKGMMSQTGSILRAVKPKKGIGGIM